MFLRVAICNTVQVHFVTFEALLKAHIYEQQYSLHVENFFHNVYLTIQKFRDPVETSDVSFTSADQQMSSVSSEIHPENFVIVLL